MIEGEPDWMAADFDSLWVRTGSGFVFRIDPASGEVQEAIEVSEPGGQPEQQLCQGLGVGAASVWTCFRDTLDVPPVLVRIDPSTAEVSILEVLKSADQGRLVSHDGRVWVISPTGDQLVGVTDDGAVSDPID